MKRVLLLVAVVLSFSAAPALAAPSPGSPGLGDRLFPLGQRRLRRPALRPRPALRDERADTGDRRHGHDPGQGDAGSEPLRPRLRRPERRRDPRQRAARPSSAARPRTGDHAEAAAAQRAAVHRHGLALHRPRRPRPTPTTSRRPRSSSTRRARRPRRSPTGRTCSCRPTTTRATRRASTSASTCPRAQTAVANGVKLAQWTDRGRSHFVYVQRQPMATELLQLAVGQYDVTNVGFHSGVFLRDVTVEEHHRARSSRCSTSRRRRSTRCRRASASYPFDLYGSLVVEADLGFALETQTLELMDTSLVPRLHAGHVGPDAAARALAHVVRRQRRPVRRGATCGSTRATRAGTSSSTPRSKGFLEGDTEFYPDPQGYADFDDLMKAVYAHGDEWRARVRPGRAADRARTRCSTSSATTAARSCSTRCARRSATPAFQRIERAYVDRFKRPLGLAPTTTSRSPPRSPATRRRAVPARLGLRHQDAEDARPPGLDGQPGGPGGAAGEGAPGRTHRRRQATRRAVERRRAARGGARRGGARQRREPARSRACWLRRGEENAGRRDRARRGRLGPVGHGRAVPPRAGARAALGRGRVLGAPAARAVHAAADRPRAADHARAAVARLGGDRGRRRRLLGARRPCC